MEEPRLVTCHAHFVSPWVVIGHPLAESAVRVTPNGADKPDPAAGDDWGTVDLLAIWEASRGVLQNQIDVIEQAVVAGIEGRLGIECQREAWRQAHKLAGSLGTFGFRDASRLARTLELGLAPTELLDAPHALDLSHLVIDLHGQIAEPSTGPSPVAAVGDGHVLMVDADEDQRRRLVEAAAGQGLRATAVATLRAASEFIATAPPAVVVVDAGVGNEDDAAVFLAEVADHDPGIATVVLVDPGRRGRVRGGLAGAHALLEKPVPPDDVAEAVCRLLAREQAGSKVVAVDDDPTFLVLISELLGAWGMAVTPLDDAERLWAVLEAVTPDLLLLDNDMPGVDGISLCRAIRSDARWADLPIIFLSGPGSPEMLRQMFTAGADDFVSKPVLGDELVTRVVNRIRRSRVHRERPGVDLATGLLSAVAFVHDATRLLSLSRQDGRPAVLAVCALDPPSEPALTALGRRLRQAAEPEDAVGIWSGGRLAVLLHGMTAPAAQELLGRVIHTATAEDAGPPCRASVGLAACPEDGSDVRALGVAAESALVLAREASGGGDSVEIHQSPGHGRAEVVDVLLVDDDEALGTLVVHALSHRGMSVRWLRDGGQAVQLLDDPAFRARVVLLDVGLPGLDGLSVLRHLGQQGRLHVTRVVMLTLRSNDSEVLEALDLGAFDHVGKPFSLPVLIHRVRRAIEASG